MFFFYRNGVICTLYYKNEKLKKKITDMKKSCDTISLRSSMN